MSSLESAFPSLSSIIGPDADHSPWIRMITVSSLTGSATIDGVSGGLGNELDAALLQGLRAWADVIVVGTGTIRGEDYGGVTPTADRPHPAPIAALTISLSLDPESRFFTEATTAPLLVCPARVISDPEMKGRRAALEAAGGIFVDSGNGTMREVIDALVARGLTKIVCEGGPGIYSAFIAEDLVDQLYLTLSPHLSSAVEKALVSDSHANEAGTSTPKSQRLRLEWAYPHPDSTVFLRYGRATAL